jgi:hypothetical protein
MEKSPNTPVILERTKEVSRKEDTGFNPATVAAVGWAMPTITIGKNQFPEVA